MGKCSDTRASHLKDRSVVGDLSFPLSASMTIKNLLGTQFVAQQVAVSAG